MKELECDRCGKPYNFRIEELGFSKEFSRYPAYISDRVVIEEVSMGGTVIKDIKRCDLCPECTKELKKWLDGVGD